MPVIRTVRGDIDPGTLGITYPHEHLITRPPAVEEDLCLDSEQAAAREQIELLRGEGVDPRHLILGHTDRNLDWDYHVGLLQTGVTLVYDQLSKEKYQPDGKRVDFILRLVKAGFGKQLMLSGDLARKSYWPSYGNWGGPGLTYILWRFVPWLYSEGLAASAIDDILIHTPARALQIPA